MGAEAKILYLDLYRENRRGKVDMAERACSVDGCEHPSRARGLCRNHYAMFRRRGTTEPITSLEGHGRSGQLMYFVWRGMRNSTVPHDPKWDNYFVWAKDVGERPSARHRFRRINRFEPIGPDNFQWAANGLDANIAEGPRTTARKRNRKAGEHRKRHLEKTFGLSQDQYGALLAAQEGVCACCGKPPSTVHKITYSMSHLVVDHDHDTGDVRGLLCHKCNSGLGMLGDNIDGIERAWRYLRAASGKVKEVA